jgi:hypothetical protein
MRHAIYKLINITSFSPTSRVANFRRNEPDRGKSAPTSYPLHRFQQALRHCNPVNGYQLANGRDYANHYLIFNISIDYPAVYIIYIT